MLVSVVQGQMSLPTPSSSKRETTMLGSRNATTEDFETVIAAMKAGRVPVAALATHRLSLAEVPTRFAELLDPALVS